MCVCVCVCDHSEGCVSPRRYFVTVGVITPWGNIHGSNLKHSCIIGRKTSHGVNQNFLQQFRLFFVRRQVKYQVRFLTNGVQAEHMDHIFLSSEICFSSVIMIAFIILFELLANFMPLINMIQVFSFNSVLHNPNLILNLSTDKDFI